MVQWSRLLRWAPGALLLAVFLSACGAAPVAENWPGLTVDGDTVYVISGTPRQVYLLDAETGITRATFMPMGEHKGILYWSPVTVGGGLAFVGFAEPQAKIAGLYAFDPVTGQEQWNVPVDSRIEPAPVYADGVVYVGSDDGKVFAIDVETRRVKPGWPFITRSAVWASPLVVEGRVYVAGTDHHVYSLDAETGELLWKQRLSGAMAAQPTYDAGSGALFVGNFVARLQALRADAGEPVEGFDFAAENWIWSEVLLHNGKLYVTALDGKLYALDPATGAVIPPYPYDSRQATGLEKERIRAAPVAASDSIVVATESGYVISVADARPEWVWPAGTSQSSILTTPVLQDGIVYVALLDGQVHTLDAETGVQGWSFSPPEAP